MSYHLTACQISPALCGTHSARLPNTNWPSKSRCDKDKDDEDDNIPLSGLQAHQGVIDPFLMQTCHNKCFVLKIIKGEDICFVMFTLDLFHWKITNWYFVPFTPLCGVSTLLIIWCLILISYFVPHALQFCLFYVICWCFSALFWLS